MGGATQPIYLDYAAATPVHPDVLSAMLPYFSESFANPSAAYSFAQTAHDALEAARSDVAQILGVQKQTVIFTAGATESINIAIHGVLSGRDAHVVTSAIEHEAVLGAVEQFDHSLAPVDTHGRVQVDELLDLITDRTELVSVMYANNEVGTIQPLAEIAEALKDIRKQRAQNGNDRPLYLHTDASQAASYVHVNMNRLGVDLCTLNGGKMYGPKQSGMLYVHQDITLTPLTHGGGQERALRSGTENVAAAVGFAAALKRAQANRKEISAQVGTLRDELWKRIQIELPDTQLNGHQKKRLANSLNISVAGLDGERAVMELDEKGVLVATGSACSASSDESSHVLRAMGRSEDEASGSLRITLGEPTTQVEIEAAAEAIIVVCTR